MMPLISNPKITYDGREVRVIASCIDDRPTKHYIGHTVYSLVFCDDLTEIDVSEFDGKFVLHYQPKGE